MTTEEKILYTFKLTNIFTRLKWNIIYVSTLDDNNVLFVFNNDTIDVLFDTSNDVIKVQKLYKERDWSKNVTYPPNIPDIESIIPIEDFIKEHDPNDLLVIQSFIESICPDIPNRPWHYVGELVKELNGYKIEKYESK